MYFYPQLNWWQHQIKYACLTAVTFYFSLLISWLLTRGRVHREFPFLFFLICKKLKYTLAKLTLELQWKQHDLRVRKYFSINQHYECTCNNLFKMMLENSWDWLPGKRKKGQCFRAFWKLTHFVSWSGIGKL